MTTLITKCTVPHRLVGLLKEALDSVSNERPAGDSTESARRLTELSNYAVVAEANGSSLNIHIVTWYLRPVVNWLSERGRDDVDDLACCTQLRVLLQPTWNNGIMRAELP